MAKNSTDAYGAEGKTNLLVFDPEKLYLVTEKDHYLYDERVHNKFDEATVLNMMALGVKTPITIVKDKVLDKVCVVDGRQRVINAREANRRLLEKGLEPLQIKAVAERGDDGELASIMVAQNEIRTEDSPMNKAMKMHNLSKLGKTTAQIAIIFGVTPQTVANIMALNECIPQAQKALEQGKITAGQARDLSKLTVEEQKEQLAALLEAGEGKTGHEKTKAQREVKAKTKKSGKPAGPKLRGKKEIAAELEGKHSPVVKRVLNWVLGLSEEL